MDNLTAIQRRALVAIADHIAETGCPPTFRQLGQRLGYRASSSSAHRVVAELDKRGWLARGSKGARQTMRLLRPVPRSESEALTIMTSALQRIALAGDGAGAGELSAIAVRALQQARPDGVQP